MMGFLGFFKALFGICVTKPLADNMWSLGDSAAKVKVGDVAELSAIGGAVYLQGKSLAKPILVVKSQNGDYLAFTNSCMHAGRRLDPVAGEDKLRCCSIGHSQFDYDGNVVSGTAKDPLKKHEAELVEDGVLIIKL
jgi:cytochrome b6-f complex iron-sulfur subunit